MGEVSGPSASSSKDVVRALLLLAGVLLLAALIVLLLRLEAETSAASIPERSPDPAPPSLPAAPPALLLRALPAVAPDLPDARPPQPVLTPSKGAPLPIAPEPEAFPRSTRPTKTIHIVRAGETLSRIARLYASTVPDLTRLNGIRNPDLILPGQGLRIR